MQKFVYYAPTEIVFGRGEEARAAELVQRYGGKRVFVIYGGNSAKKSGLLARIEENLRAAGLSVLSVWCRTLWFRPRAAWSRRREPFRRTLSWPSAVAP